MNKKKTKRLLSLLLSLAMVFTLTAAPAFAAGTLEESVSGSVAEDDTGQSYENVDETIETLDTTDDAEEETATITTVAKIGTAEYDSLASAFAAATDGCTITLTSDVTVTGAEYNGDGYYQVSGKTVTLDLH